MFYYTPHTNTDVSLHADGDFPEPDPNTKDGPNETIYETISLLIPIGMFDKVLKEVSFMQGIVFSEGKLQKEIDSRFYKTLDAKYTQTLSWITSIASTIRKNTEDIVRRLALEELRQKTGHWKRGEFKSSENCVLDTTEQTKMFMGKQHQNKKEIEKTHGVCIYIITCAALDEKNKILVAPQDPNGNEGALKNAFDDIESRVASIKQTTNRNNSWTETYSTYIQM